MSVKLSFINESLRSTGLPGPEALSIIAFISTVHAVAFYTELRSYVYFRAFLLYNKAVIVNMINQKGCDSMKLIYVIVRNIDSGDVTQALNKQGFYVTKLASTGGFLREGNTTLMIGTDAEKVDEVIKIVKDTCGPRKQIISNPIGPGEYAAMNVVVNVGGATIFVTEVDRFEKL